jgi:hypothetical protein
MIMLVLVAVSHATWGRGGGGGGRRCLRASGAPRPPPLPLSLPYLGVGVLGEAGVEDGVRHLVGQFVGVALVDRFGREEEGLVGHLVVGEGGGGGRVEEGGPARWRESARASSSALGAPGRRPAPAGDAGRRPRIRGAEGGRRPPPPRPARARQPSVARGGPLSRGARGRPAGPARCRARYHLAPARRWGGRAGAGGAGGLALKLAPRSASPTPGARAGDAGGRAGGARLLLTLTGGSVGGRRVVGVWWARRAPHADSGRRRSCRRPPPHAPGPPQSPSGCKCCPATGHRPPPRAGRRPRGCAFACRRRHRSTPPPHATASPAAAAPDTSQAR